ncbi:MAG: hypothetical protein ACFBSF_22815 [Leptolyngbyaceae cyanobacterium]
MSLFDYLFDSDFRQRRDLNENREQVDRLSYTLRRRADDLASRIEELEDENSELKLVCLALMQTLVEHDLMTEEGFLQTAEQIRANVANRRGQFTGRILPEPEPKSTLRSGVGIDYTSARQKPKSLER